jgi:hypothetical protein
LPTFIAVVLGSACLVAGGMRGFAVFEDAHVPAASGAGAVDITKADRLIVELIRISSDTR